MKDFDVKPIRGLDDKVFGMTFTFENFDTITGTHSGKVVTVVTLLRDEAEKLYRVLGDELQSADREWQKNILKPLFSDIERNEQSVRN